MTEDELLTAIENTMQAAHRQCQPYFVQLAKLLLPGIAVARTETYISATPAGSHARIDRLSIALMQEPLVAT
jgi:hypothetical protein